MSEWIVVQFPETPDIQTRVAIADWVERCVHGRCLVFNRRDPYGRLNFGLEFERAEDTAKFKAHWFQTA